MEAMGLQVRGEPRPFTKPPTSAGEIPPPAPPRDPLPPRLAEFVEEGIWPLHLLNISDSDHLQVCL